MLLRSASLLEPCSYAQLPHVAPPAENLMLSCLTLPLQSLVGSFELREYSEGMVIAWAGEVDDCMYVIKSGQCLLTTAVTPAQRQALQDQTLQGSAMVPRVQSLGGEKLEAGARHGEQALLTAQARATTMLASKDGTQVSSGCSCPSRVCSHAMPASPSCYICCALMCACFAVMLCLLCLHAVPACFGLSCC